MRRQNATAAASVFLFAAGAANAQSLIDTAALQDIDDVDIVAADGTDVGEIEEILIDESGRVVALAIETGGFLDIGDDEVIFALDQLTYRDGDYVTELSQEEIEALPRYD